MRAILKVAACCIAAIGFAAHIRAGTVSGEPASDFRCSFDGNNTPTGWFTGWGGEEPNSYVWAPNGQGFSVADGKHPWYGLAAKDTFSVALYADISAVDASATPKILLAMGNNGGHIALVKRGADTVEVWQGKAKAGDLAIALQTLGQGFHFFAFGNSAEGAFLSVDGTRVTGSALTKPNTGLQVGALYQGFGGDTTTWNKGLGMVVDEVRGYDRVLTAEECAMLAFQVSRRTLSGDEVWSAANAWTPVGAPNKGEGATNPVEAVLTVSANGTLTMDASAALDVLTVAGAGTLTLASGEGEATGRLTATATSLAADTVLSSDVASLGAATIAAGKTLTVAGGTSFGTLSGAGALAKAGAGTTQTLTGANAYAGGTQVREGTLRLEGAGTLGTGAVTVAEGAEVAFANDGTVANAFSGAGTLTKEGTGTVRLTGDGVAFVGPVKVLGGELALSKRFRPTVATVADGATLTVTANPSNKIVGECFLRLSAECQAGGKIKVPAYGTATEDTVYTLTADDIAKGEVTVSIPAEPTVTGDGWWWDYEFNGNVSNTGSEGTGLQWDGDRPFRGNEYVTADDVTALRLPARPWRTVSAYPETFTAVMRVKAGKTANGVLVSFGSSVAGEKYSITLAAGADSARGDMRLLLTHKGATNGEQGTVTDLVDNLSVPNATGAYHLYAFTFRKAVEVDGVAKTAIDIYKDGDRLRRYVHADGVITLGLGFQVGSIHGGMGAMVDAPSQAGADDTSTMDFLRVFRGELSDKAHRELAEAYPYASPNGEATRTVSGTADWEAENAWSQGGELQSAPNADTNVALTASADATVTLNLSADTDYETLKLKAPEGATEAVSVTLAPADPASVHTLKVAGLMTVETNATFPVTGMSLGRVFVAVNRTLTFDCATLPPDTVSKALTGYVLDDIQGRFAATNLPEDGPWAFEFGYDASTGEFRIVRRPETAKALSASVSGAVAWAEVPWTWAGASEGQAPLPLNLEGLSCPLTVRLAEGTLSSPAAIDYSGALTLEGTGAVSLSNANATGALTVAAGASPRLTGTWAGPVTFADGAVLDASEGVLTASGTVTYDGALTVRLPEGFVATEAGTQVLAKTGAALPAGTVTLLAGTEGIEDAFLEARADGLYVTRPTVALPEGETASEAANKALAAAAVRAGVRTLTVDPAGCSLDGAALFTGVLTVTPDADDHTQGTATVDYDFGIPWLTIRSLPTAEGGEAALYVVLAVQVRGADGADVGYAQGTTVQVVRPGETGADATVLPSEAIDPPQGAPAGLSGTVKFFRIPYAPNAEGSPFAGHGTFPIKARATNE